MPYETYTPLFHEICTKVNNAKDKPAKIKVLRQYRTAALEMFFKSALCPEVEWMLPEGDVPFIPNDAPEGTEHTLLSASMNKVHNYVRLNRNKLNLEPVVGNPDLNRMKREMMFIQLLEGLHEKEALLLIDAKNKAINKKYKGLNATTVCEAYGWNENFEPLNAAGPGKDGRDWRGA